MKLLVDSSIERPRSSERPPADDATGSGLS